MEREVEESGKGRAVWSEEDEIVVLQGIIDFAIDQNKSFSQHKCHPFHDFVKTSLVPLRPTPYQLSEKIRSLRRKYMVTKKKKKKKRRKYIMTPRKTAFFRDHDLECLELCKRIWHPDGTPFEAISSKKNEDSESAEKETDSDSDSFLHSFIAGLGLDEDLCKRGWCSMVTVKDKKEFEERYRVFQSEALEVFMQSQQLLYEIASALLSATSNLRIFCVSFY